MAKRNDNNHVHSNHEKMIQLLNINLNDRDIEIEIKYKSVEGSRKDRK